MRHPYLRRIELSNYGEAFLNPQLLQILEYACERGVAINIANGANLNTAKEDVLEGLVKFGVRALTCSTAHDRGVYEIPRQRTA